MANNIKSEREKQKYFTWWKKEALEKEKALQEIVDLKQEILELNQLIIDIKEESYG